MLRLLIATLLCSSFLFANVQNYKNIEEFYSISLKNEKEYKLNKITIHNSTNESLFGNWSAYFVTLELKVQDKNITLKDVIFYDGVFISKDFLNPKEGKSLKANILKEWDKYVK